MNINAMLGVDISKLFEKPQVIEAVNILAEDIIAIVLLFYLIKDKHEFREAVSKLLPNERDLDGLIEYALTWKKTVKPVVKDIIREL